MKGAFVSGQFVDGEGRQFDVVDPSTGQPFQRLSGASPDQVEAAIVAARDAYDRGDWAELPMAKRAALLRRFIAALADRAEEMKDIIAQEAGCPRFGSSMRSQVDVPLGQANEILELALSLPEVEDNPLPLDHRVNALGQSYQSVRRYGPTGVVAAIAAYNYPFLTAMWKVLPALVTGNAVILRPSPLTPLTCEIFAEAALTADLPAGIFGYVVEEGTEGAELLTSHPAVDMVAFTGSSLVGVKVMQQAAPTMKRLQLELGGKSAQIFLPDSLDKVVPVVKGAVTAHAGQGCAIGTRIFVPQGEKDALLADIEAAFRGIAIGRADSRDTVLGPVISAAQVERCEHFVDAARRGGGRVVTGGKRPEGLGEGFFFEPTILDLPGNDNPAAQEEIFGPVVSVIGYRDLHHAIEMANDSRFGLSGYVFGADRRKALEVGKRIKSGTVNVNGAAMSSYVSAGGQRMSGVGRERGPEGIRIYQQMTCLNLGA